ncbi:MAG TPA: cupin domain-containing protein [Burkholderiales bacterium]|nr:cupin domain-containing protein [Burkholderiales bacterium]
MSSVAATNQDRAAALDALHDDIERKHMFPFWAVSAGGHDEVKRLMGAAPRAVPFLWSYAEVIQPILVKAAKLVTTVESERRSLILVNPGLAPRRATVTTMYTAYRLNSPNEVMPPHRHSPSAIRFGLTGKQNFTGVEGEDMVFGPGDLVLTPQDAWHNHGCVGDEPAVNLSVLDLPLVENLNAVFFEHDYKEDGQVKNRQSARVTPDYSGRIYGTGGYLPRFVKHERSPHSSPMYCYRWEPLRELLERHEDWDGDPYDALSVEYVDPVNGGPIFKTMTFFAQMLRPGERTRAQRQTASLLVTPFEGGGMGHSLIGGKRYDWQSFDTLAIPAGEWYEHVNSSKSPIVLFVASDEPALRAFGLHKKWGRTAAGDVEQLT